MIRKFFYYICFSILIFIGLDHPLLACKSCNPCRLIEVGAGLSAAARDQEWARMVEFYTTQTKFEFPRLFARMMTNKQARERVTAWEEKSPNYLGVTNTIIGRRYEIPAAIHSSFSFLHFPGQNIEVSLSNHNPKDGVAMPVEKKQIIVNAITTFGYLLFKFIEANPSAKAIVIKTVTIETPEMQAMLEQLGFTPYGTGMILELKAGD